MQVNEGLVLQEIKKFCAREITGKMKLKGKKLEKAIERMSEVSFYKVTYTGAVEKLLKTLKKDGELGGINGYNYFYRDGKYYREKI